MDIVERRADWKPIADDWQGLGPQVDQACKPQVDSREGEEEQKLF